MFSFVPEDFGDGMLQIDAGEGGVSEARFVPDDNSILVLAGDRCASVYDAATGQRRYRLSADDVISTLVSPDGQTILTISADHVARCWSVSDGRSMAKFGGHRQSISDAAFLANGSKLLTASLDGTAYVWDTRTGNTAFALSGHEGHDINSVGVSADGSMLVTTSDQQRSVVVWSSENGEATAYAAWIGESRPIRALFHPHDGTLALLQAYGPTEILRIGEWTDGQPLPSVLHYSDLKGLRDKDPTPYLLTERTLDDEFGRVGSFSPDGEYLLVICQGPRDNPTIWRVVDGTEVSTLRYEDQITSIASFSKTGSHVLTATGSHPNVIADGEKFDSQVAGIWDVATGKNLFLLHGHENTVTSACFSTDGKKILTAALDRKVLVWPIDIEAAALFAAAYLGDENAVDAHLQNGADRGAQFDGMIACHTAAAEGHDTIVERLLELEDSVDVRTGAGATPLFLAAKRGHLGLVRRLLDQGADANAQQHDGGVPLHLAATGGHYEIVDVLLNSGADVDAKSNAQWTPLFTALVNERIDIARLLIERGADVGICASDGGTAIYAAAYHGYTEIVQELLTRGADPNPQNDGGYSPLYVAAEHGHVDVMRALLAGGAEMGLRTKRQFTALHAAESEGRDEAVTLLLENGAEIDARTDQDDTALNLAATNGHPTIARELLTAGASVELPNEGGFAPLHSAAYSGHSEIVELLLRAGSEIDAPGPDAQTSLWSAACVGHTSVVELLLAKGADPNAARKDGVTPLAAAVSNHHREAVRLLLEAGADPHARFSDKTALDYASDEAIRQMLLNT